MSAVPVDERDLWNDPWQEADGRGNGGVLLSNQIDYYATRGLLVAPYDPALLRPAAYTLTVGHVYWKDGIPKRLEAGEEVTIPRNGLVYVKAAERLRIPHYLVARYSLKVKLVYSGLVLDNGLQVDPGYEGYLHIPVYNLCDTERRIRQGDPFLSIDFARTTPFVPAPVAPPPTSRSRLITSASGWTIEDVNQMAQTAVTGVRNALATLEGYRESPEPDARAAVVAEIEHLKLIEDLYSRNRVRFEVALGSANERACRCKRHPCYRGAHADVIEFNCLLIQALCPALDMKAHGHRDSQGNRLVLFYQHPEEVRDRDLHEYLRHEDKSHRSSLESMREDHDQHKRKVGRFMMLGYGTLAGIVIAGLALLWQFGSWASAFRELNADSRNAFTKSAQPERMCAELKEELSRVGQVSASLQKQISQMQNEISSWREKSGPTKPAP